ncbi:MAG: LamG domain-containing protein [Spirochaetales bacterium]|nr:LamG domain-containing protein [Spirochaetales bacterium]
MKNLLKYITKLFSIIVLISFISGCNLFLTTVSAFQDETDASNKPATTSLPALENIVSAPMLIGPGLTNNAYPGWTWTSGEKGTGVFRYKLDDPDLSTGAIQNDATTYVSGTSLNAGSHKFYLQEMNNDNQWSEQVSAEAFIDFTAPTVFGGISRTTGISFVTNANAYDSNGIACFNWSASSGPGNLNFSNPESLCTSISADTSGEYTIMLDVSDKAGNSNFSTFIIYFDRDAQILLPFNGNSQDESAFGRHPVKVSGPTMVSDRFGNPDSAFDVENGYLKIEQTQVPDLSGDFTIAFWFKRHASGGDAFQSILSNNGNENLSLGLVYNPGLGHLFRITIDGTAMLFNNGADPAVGTNDYSWHHAAVVFEKSSPNNSLSLYYDGVFIRSASCNKTLNPLSSNDLLIGRGYSAESNYSGDVDDILIYSESKTESEIQGIYNRP